MVCAMPPGMRRIGRGSVAQDTGEDGMRMRGLLLGSTALVGAGVLGVGVAPGVASAAEVLPGGALNITLSGFGRFRGHGGQLDNQYNQGRGSAKGALSTGVDFS